MALTSSEKKEIETIARKEIKDYFLHPQKNLETAISKNKYLT
jgi:hypothetical protein